ncbi:hypothetical protein GW17_00004612 [Ensete ventricosum]|nr:hypothetical protein GW17_00004612 [Ensete ventricosum]
MDVSFHVEEKVLMLHGTEFRSRLGMTTNTPSSVYKPLHEYRILRVSNSPHLCEFYTTLSVVTQHVPLCTVSSLTKYPTCIEHYQVWLSTSSPEKATNHDGKHHGEPEEQPTLRRLRQRLTWAGERAEGCRFRSAHQIRTSPETEVNLSFVHCGKGDLMPMT